VRFALVLVAVAAVTYMVVCAIEDVTWRSVVDMAT
jgi:hypothetical protein